MGEKKKKERDGGGVWLLGGGNRWECRHRLLKARKSGSRHIHCLLPLVLKEKGE